MKVTHHLVHRDRAVGECHCAQDNAQCVEPVGESRLVSTSLDLAPNRAIAHIVVRFLLLYTSRACSMLGEMCWGALALAVVFLTSVA